MTSGAADIIKASPKQSREAARLVINTDGEPHEATQSLLPGTTPALEAVLAGRVFFEHALRRHALTWCSLFRQP